MNPRRCRLRLARWALLLAALAAAGAHAFDLDALAAQLAAPAVVRGPFVQEKHLRGLEQPLASRGHFVLARDAGLLWRLEQPLALDYRITAATIARRSETGWQPQPDNAAGARQRRLFLALLSGDRSGLERDFALAVSGSADDWTLTLTPRSALLAQIFARIEIRGGATVARIDLFEAQGDLTRVRLPASEVDSQLSAAERADFAD